MVEQNSEDARVTNMRDEMAGKMKRALKRVLLVAFVAVACFTAFAVLFEFKEVVRARGIVEAVDAVEVRSLARGILTDVDCTENEYVELGQRLAVLEHGELEHAVRAASNDVARAAAVLGKARAELEILAAGPRKEAVRLSEEQVEQASLKRDLAEKRFRSVESLFSKEYASREDVDRARMEYQIAASALEEARARLAIVEKGPLPEELRSSQSAVREAEALYAREQEVLRNAISQLAQAEICSPCEGQIVAVADGIDAGKLIQAGDLVAVVSRNHAKLLRLWVGEHDTGKLRLGQEVESSSLMYPRRRDRCIGRVQRIRPYGESKRGQQHYEVEVLIEKETVPLKLGSTAWAKVHVGNRTILEAILGTGERLGQEPRGE